jgi:hypothetical protein
MGRRNTFTNAMADEICRRLSDGESLRAICEGEKMPAESTVRLWALNDVHGFAARYARARELGYLALGDEIIHISNTPQIGTKSKTDDTGKTEVTEGDMIEHRRLQVDARKWFLSKVLPKVFGDKLDVTVEDVTDRAAQMRQRREARLAARHSGR